MRLTRRALHLLPFLLAGCTTATRQPQPPAPEPARQELPPQRPSASSWVFAYAPGVVRYRVTRSATVENVSDSVPIREITTNLTHETLGLERIGDTIQFTVVVDTFTTTTQDLVGPAQMSALPIQLSGLLVHDTLQLVADSLAAECSPSLSAIRTDAHNLIVPFPARLDQDAAWTDSLETAGCQAMIPTTARIQRAFRVAGETLYSGSPVVVVQRRDTIQAHGEGAQRQHRMVLDATGSGSALYYLNPSTGQIVAVTIEQSLHLVITASGKLNNFTQTAKQEFALVR
jgi:hypothetical protein